MRSIGQATVSFSRWRRSRAGRTIHHYENCKFFLHFYSNLKIFPFISQTENGLTHMYVKVPFPESAINDDGKCQNLIGRILGPRGISVRQLEMLYGCKILIRGKGSVKDAAKEKRLRGKPEGRHLEEKLHVLVEVQDLTHEMCARKLANAKQCIEKLMVPVVVS